MRSFFLLFLCVLITHSIFAQTGKGSISFTVSSAQGPVDGATAELLRPKDSAWLKTAISDKAGLVSFEQLGFGDYIVRISAVGLSPYHTSLLTISEAQSQLSPAPVTLSALPTGLQTITVVAKKPFIQKLNDRIVVNVENSIVSAGSTALDILERSPGVTLDQNDAISLRGRAGVIIMIDGKPTPMSGADLANYLRGLPSGSIERIDIITNPSARYDAAGNSGIIDIRLKKDQRFGTNGTFTGGFGQGVYPKANAGASFNYRNKKVNVFGNYNYAYREHLNHLIINRNFYENGVFKGSDDKDNFAWMPFRSHTARIGADFFPSDKTIIGVVVNGNFNRFQRRAVISTTVNDLQYRPDFRFFSNGTNDDRFNNGVANLNFKHRFDSTGRELTADLDYGTYRSASLTRTTSAFYNLDGTRKKEDDILDGDQNGRLHFKTAKADYTQPLHEGKLEIGVKTSLVSSDNDAKFYNVKTTGTEVDAAKTNHFFYKEYNHAGYVNWSREYKNVNLQLGLRGEQTDIRTRQVKGDRRFNNAYFRLFPSAFFNYKLAENKTLGLSVSRRIDRPGYSELDPFLLQVDATIYATGDPLLKPQMTWSYEMSYTVKSLNFTLGYSRTTDPQSTVLSKILDVIPNFEIKPGQDSNITVQIPVNLKRSDYAGLTATLPLRITKWWNTVNNVNVYYNHFDANLGGTRLDNGNAAANLRTNNTFTLPKAWAAEFNVGYNTGGRDGYMVMRSQWNLSAGAQKTLLKGKGTLRLNVTDLLWTNRPRAKVVYEGSYIENWQAYRDSRVATLSFTYRFGSSKVQQARHRSTASEEERQRAGG